MFSLYTKIKPSIVPGHSTSGDETVAEKYKKLIINKIKGIDETSVEHSVVESNLNQEEVQLTQEEIELSIMQEKESDEFLDSVHSKFTDWIANIEKEAREMVQSSDEGDRDNLMYNEPFVGFFRKLCKVLPLWTAVCCDVFESPYETSSSANVESDFKNIKLSMKDIIPCRVDVFLERHLRMIDGAVKIASQRYLGYVSDDNCESNEEKDPDSVHDDFDFMSPTESLPTSICTACANNHLPSDAHKCNICGRNVHILPGCSLSIGDEEGFGEKRICIICSTESSLPKSTRPPKKSKSTKESTKPLRQSKRIIENKDQTKATNSKENGKNELNHKESWNKRTKRSHYLKPSPHWDLITNVDKKVKLGLLCNGNLSTITHMVDKRPVGMRNTCAFDSLVQVLFLKDKLFSIDAER